MKNFRKILAIAVCMVMMVTFVPILQGIEAEASTFTPRTTQPDSSNTYYYADNVFYKSGYGMPNCTAYAYGRAYEILGSKPNLCTSNACDWYSYNKNHGYYSYGSTPKLGAIACWGSNDGKAGHVAVVEIISGSTVTLSESHYGGTYWDLKTMSSDGSDYLTAKGFQGYIYIGDFSSNNAPVMCLDSIAGGVGTLTVTGWAYDPDSPSTSIDVHVYIGGSAGSSDAYGVSIGSTGVYRSDVNSAFGISGNHGFSYTIDLTDTGVSGTKDVYVYALDTGGGDNTCTKSSATITKNSSPDGCFDSAEGHAGSVTLTGWAYDPDVSGSSIDVHVYIGGQAGDSSAYGIPITANVYRSDVNSAKGISGNHGFSVTVDLSDTDITGTKSVYVYAIDTSGVKNTLLSNSPRTVTISSPYTVTYNANGGSGAPSTQKKAYGINLTLSSTKPTRTGYTFKNWNTASGGTGTSYSAGAAYTANSSATLYAQWTANTYTIAYNANGGSGAPSSQTKTYGTALTLSSTVPTRTGYTFTGWNTAANGSGTSYAAGASYTANSAATLYAQWTINTYTIAYNANGGSGAPSSQTKTYGTALTLSSTVPTRTGYTFTGWNTASDGSGTSYAAGASYTANSAATLYAQWTINTYTIAYNANGGSGAPSSQTKTYGTALTLSSTVPTRTGYTFTGWNTAADGSGTSYAAGASYTANAAATLYAQWEEVNHPVKSVTLDVTSLSLNEGETEEIKATVLPENASDKSVTWESSDESVATVSNGVVTAVSLGTAVITVITEDGGYTAECSVKVIASGTIGDLTWVLEDGTLTISGSGAMPDYVDTNAPWYDYTDSIQNAVIGDGVTCIGCKAFYNCTALKSVTISDSVTSIRSWAFDGCVRLMNITIPDSVTSIGSAAFRGCCSLTSIAIPKNVTDIGTFAFYYCSSLTGVTIPESVTSIGSSTFAYCSSLKSITIPNSVTSIGSYAFSECSSLTSITIPDSVTSIGNAAFNFCSSLTSVTLSNSITSIGSYAFSGSGLMSITIPGNVTSIGEGAFSVCGSLTSAAIPLSVTSIGKRAFYGCSSLASIYYAGSQEDWESVTVGENSGIEAATVYYNMSEIPGEAGMYDVNYIKGGTAEDGEFYAEVSVTKNADKSGADVVIAAAYKDGALVAVGSAEIQISSGETTILQISLDADEDCELKAFVWDSLDNMTPLCGE